MILNYSDSRKKRNISHNVYRSEAVLASVVGTGEWGVGDKGEKGIVIVDGLTLLLPESRPIPPPTTLHVTTETLANYIAPAESVMNRRQTALKTVHERSSLLSVIFYYVY